MAAHDATGNEISYQCASYAFLYSSLFIVFYITYVDFFLQTNVQTVQC